jgi:hypothetical protein
MEVKRMEEVEEEEGVTERGGEEEEVEKGMKVVEEDRELRLFGPNIPLKGR